MCFPRSSSHVAHLCRFFVWSRLLDIDFSLRKQNKDVSPPGVPLCGGRPGATLLRCQKQEQKKENELKNKSLDVAGADNKEALIQYDAKRRRFIRLIVLDSVLLYRCFTISLVWFHNNREDNRSPVVPGRLSPSN